jgi:nicotinic acid phosphoribosyltransferase
MNPTSFPPLPESLLDSDIYQFTIVAVIAALLVSDRTVYRFVCRNRPAYPLAELRSDMEAHLDHLCNASAAVKRSSRSPRRNASSKRREATRLLRYLRQVFARAA